ncbi:hypothetical protein VE01_02456 [Pseudogymnoascus verrucosus]|uniref:CENP-V/GFA domain-containing protein n=1 Tax=Pseudogymnoascus verrucosus TaxID=342668 RepID=A0A1B8GSY4_9PEZI|nr:uncharacterized protein VE01_02456 [Pseudogymnoascus verrucosus]OBT98943.1 hypothetical protein VE01_02456 [Pseudogymnoascus verrucosus]
MSAKVDPADFKTYHGGCHCGAFKFAIRIPELKDIMACNCSICIKNGILGNIWFRDDGPEEFIVEKGDIDALKKYSFERKNAVYRFCGVCGTNVFVKDPEEIGINARSLDDIDVEPLPRKPWDGWKKGTPYAPEFGQQVEWKKPEGKDEEKTEDDLITYHGNCHCGKIRYALRSKDLYDMEVMQCNCSMCGKNSHRHIYPTRTALQVHDPEGAASKYNFLSKDSAQTFCSNCGTFVFVDIEDQSVDLRPLNVRTIDDIDIYKLKYNMYDGRSKPPLYTGERHKLD